MTVQSIRLRYLLIAPVRLVLSVVWLAAAHAAGAAGGVAEMAFGAAAFVTAFLLWNDPRARFWRGLGEPAELPGDARVAPAWLHAVQAALPSTVGVSVLAAAALVFRPTLSALLAGILAGLGVAALLAAYSIDARLYFDPQSNRLFRRSGPIQEPAGSAMVDDSGASTPVTVPGDE